MKNYLFLFIMIILSSNTFCQSYLTDSTYLKNDSIKYEIVFKTRSILSQKHDKKIGYYIDLDIPKPIKQKLIKKDSIFWINKLSDETSDWAANLVLYYIFDREAVLIKAVENDRTKWMKIRTNEIEYWRKFLSRR